MRWLILGPYTPEQSPGAAATTAAAIARLDAGDDVHVVSPRPSAAHEHRPLQGWRALLLLARAARPDVAVWIRVEPGVLLTRTPSRVDSLLERMLLSYLLRRSAESVLDVGDVALFPGGRAGALVFGPVGELVVHDYAHSAALIAAGARPESVRLDEPSAVVEVPEAPQVGDASEQPAVGPADFSNLGGDADRRAIEAAVAARAAEAPVSGAPRS